MNLTAADLPGLDCGVCGFRTCAALAERLPSDPDLLKRCIYYGAERKTSGPTGPLVQLAEPAPKHTGAGTPQPAPGETVWQDSLGRDFDFFLEHFPSEPGPREIILPHNPLLTRELEIKVGDTLIGRPLGMSCGCPITHCGVVMQVDSRTGIIVWCVTGPMRPRQEGFKDLGYYSAEAYEGLITKARAEIKIGLRYFFQPTRCMLQWRHSGLVNYVNRTPQGTQVRLEGLWIG
jgi:uncharacterized Fe-S cluster-containing protein